MGHSKHVRLEVKTRVYGIWLHERIAEILAGSAPFIFSLLGSSDHTTSYNILLVYVDYYFTPNCFFPYLLPEIQYVIVLI